MKVLALYDRDEANLLQSYGLDNASVQEMVVLLVEANQQKMGFSDDLLETFRKQILNTDLTELTSALVDWEFQISVLSVDTTVS